MRNAKKLSFTVKAFLALSILVVAQAVATRGAWASAGSPQTCTLGSSCEIGEFLYDDEYGPITTADICSINAKYPDGTSLLTDQNMPPAGENDGWYSYSFTTPSTTGYYRVEVCCTVDGQKLCVDKSFEAQEAPMADTGSIASAVWSYSDRTLSSFGSLASDVWNFSTRSLSTSTI